MLDLKFDYRDCVALSERVYWKLDDLFPADTKLEFDRPHLPDALASVKNLSALYAQEQLALNHIRGNSYMNLFGFVEEYIIAQMTQHAHAELFGDHQVLRALLRFADE